MHEIKVDYGPPKLVFDEEFHGHLHQISIYIG